MQQQNNKVLQGDVRRVDAYSEFIIWTSMPASERGKLGIETQREFCAKYNLGVNVPTKWKRRPDFIAEVTEIRRQWAFEKTSDVLRGIYLGAVKGNPYSQKLWLEYFLDFREKSEVGVTVKASGILIGDIQFLIDSLPEPLRTEHNVNLRKLLEDGQRLRHAGQLENFTRVESGTEEGIQDEADINAPDLSGERTDDMAGSNKISIRSNLVRETPARNNQGAERRWEIEASRNGWI